MTRPECPLLAQNEHPNTLDQCPLLGVKRTSHKPRTMSAFDPKRTLASFRYGGFQSGGDRDGEVAMTLMLRVANAR